MNIAPIADIKARLSSYIKKSRESPVVITKHGKPVAVLLSVTDEDDLELILLANSTKFQAILNSAENRIRETGGVSHEDVWASVEAEYE